MKTIAILTDAFPFGEGEQFLENEIEFWGRAQAKVVVLPRSVKGQCRPVPEGIEIDDALAASNRIIDVIRAAMGAVASRVFWRELGFLGNERRLGVVRVATLARALTRLRLLTKALESSAARHGGFDLAYSYWNDLSAYAAVMCRRRSAVGVVVSRAHGYDLYERRRRASYMPLKRQFIRSLDAIYAVSDQGADYLVRRYGAEPRQVHVARLGVSLPDSLVRPSPPGNLRIVSIGFCTPVKRVDLLVRSLGFLADSEPDLDIVWTHIGAGPLFAEVRAQARALSNGRRNVTAVFTGDIPNVEVLEHLRTSTTDLIVNVSADEGIPVSIMEAMSFGIPPVATDVGGVSELVSAPHGRLLSAESREREIADALSSFADSAKSARVRASARAVIEQDYNAKENYPAFLRSLGIS